VIVVTIDGFPARALDDPRLPMPTLRALAAQGAQAKGMVPINPTVTWPNHTAIISGVDASEHHVMANGLISFPEDGSAPRVMPWVDKDKLVHARTLYDAAAEKGLTTGQVDWVAVYGAHGIQWQFEERPDADGQIASELVSDGLVTREQVETFGSSNSAWRDQIWTDAAVDILMKHTPDLLLVHLLQTDTLQHQYGTLTPAANAAYAYADRCLSRIVEAVHVAGLTNRTTFFILSDHGFTNSTHSIRPNALLAGQGLLNNVEGSYRGSVWAMIEGGSAEVFIRNKSQAGSLIPQLKQHFLDVPGIEGVYTNEEAGALGIPSTSVTDQAPDLYLTAKEGYAFDDTIKGPTVGDSPLRGQHGYNNIDSNMQALFIAAGASVRSGIKLGVISNLRVAPTIAKILDLSLPDAKQPPLNEILR
jgi:predicted AlkP superfamily pyrophosphatase or phosphodiesterase